MKLRTVLRESTMRHSSMQRLPMTSTSGWGRASIPQQGIVMLMTLILLTVMAVSTAVAVRLSLTTDMVGANLRARTLAFQAAEAALRYCEEKVINEFSTLPMLVNYQKDEEWADDSAWAGPAKLEVPREQLGLPDNIKKNPQCLFRFLTIDDCARSPRLSRVPSRRSRVVSMPTGSCSSESRSEASARAIRNMLHGRVTSP